MKNKKKIISMTAMSLVMGSAVATANADSIMAKFREPMGISIESRQAEDEALKNADFASWKSAVESSGRTEILETINESNFARYVEAFKLRENGDMDGARAIMEELGIKEPEHGGMMKGFDIAQADRETLESALENSDYNAWKTVMEKTSIEAGLLTEEKFNILVRAYKLQASGDRSGAMDLLDNSDIPGCMLMMGGGKMHGGRGDMEGEDESNHEAITAAYENGDFASWKALIEERGGGKILEVINADNFAEFAKAKMLQSEGKMDEAKAILDDLGLPFQERGARAMGRPALAAVN